MKDAEHFSRSWWKEIIMYQIYPRSFNDSNGDGIGDLRGIIEKVDYLSDLGVNLVWLSPVYMSPNDDNGYDISDYKSIHPEFGTMDDFDELLSIFHKRGIKLIMDLVVNHSSDEHPWFEISKSSLDNQYRDYYIWRDGQGPNLPPNNYKSWFGGDAWTYDESTDQYYLHLFSKKQPDLNWENPNLRKEIYKMMRFWLDKGVDGFRMDVISLLSKDLTFANSENTNIYYLAEHHYANGPRIHEFLQEMHREVLADYDIMTVGEGPGITKEVANLYIGSQRQELHMIFQLDHMIIDYGPGGKFDFVKSDLSSLRKIFNEWDEAVGDDGWNNIFLDNHDFPRMVSRFGNDHQYRYESATLLATFVLTMRGTPCIYQGSEIGMTNVKYPDLSAYRDIESINYIAKMRDEGYDDAYILDKLHIQSRDNVRSPMQWDLSPNAGFSMGNPWIPLNPNYHQINVEKDLRSPDSIFQYYKWLIDFRKHNDVLVYGDYQDLSNDHPSLYYYRRFLDGIQFDILLNFSDESQALNEDLFNKEMIVSNYKDKAQASVLMPWEARIYRGVGG